MSIRCRLLRRLVRNDTLVDTLIIRVRYAQRLLEVVSLRLAQRLSARENCLRAVDIPALPLRRAHVGGSLTTARQKCVPGMVATIVRYLVDTVRRLARFFAQMRRLW